MVKSSDNKLLSILKPIPTFSATTNQAGSLSIGLNNTNANRNGRKNAIIIDFTIKNKG